MYGRRRLGKSTLIKRVLSENDVYSMQHIDIIERKRFSLLIGTNMVLAMRMESIHKFMSLIFSTFDIRVVPHFLSSFSSSDAHYIIN